MDEQEIIDLNSDPWRLRQMSSKELRDTIAIAQAMLIDAKEPLQVEISFLVEKCESLLVEIEQGKLRLFGFIEHMH